MRKLFIIGLIIVLTAVTGLSLQALNKQNISLVGFVGSSLGDFKGQNVGLGLELRLWRNFYVQCLYDSYMEPSALGSFNTPGINSSAHGLNLYLIYKKQLSQKLTLFGKLGVNYTTISSSLQSGVSISGSDPGTGFGLGAQYRMGKNIYFVVGGTLKALIPDSGAGIWFKSYGGISFRLK
ncbi:MAG: porin family protein [bacterium]|nr:porin family protein [bacterium]